MRKQPFTDSQSTQPLTNPDTRFSILRVIVVGLIGWAGIAHASPHSEARLHADQSGPMYAGKSTQKSGQAKAPKREKSPLVCWALPSLMNRYFENHVQYRKPNDASKERVVELYADNFDPSKSMLLEKEYAALKKRIRQLIDDTFKGRCSDFDAIHSDQVAAQGEMEGFVRKMMGQKDLKIDESLELQVDPDKRKRPKTIEERDAIRRKLLHFQLANYVQSGTKLEEAKKRLTHRYELITKRVSEMTTADIYANFLNAFSRALDPHTSYFSADDLVDFRISMDLSLEGIGAQLSSRDGYTIVQEVIPGGAADRQGKLKPKDKIIAVAQGKDGKPVDIIDMSLRDVVRLIRGKKGTTVRLTILRQTDKAETHTLLIERDKIDLKEQAAKLKWKTIKRDGKSLKLAVLQLPSFYGGDRRKGARNCTDDVRKLLREVKAEKADGLLLDLSRNGGGLLKAAVDISGLFIAEGPVVAIKGFESDKQVLQDKDENINYDGPLVVLTSRVSASASEILAGALKDYRRAIIAGDSHTFGKGTVQNIVSLPPGFGALKVTTALFFRPGGQSTQSLGVPSDILVRSPFDNEEYGERHQPYALPTVTIDQFRGKDINASKPSEGWTPVTAQEIKALSAKSGERVKTIEAFQEIDKDLAKRKKNKGVLKIADLLKDKKTEDEKRDEEKANRKKIGPQATEALNILADLIVLRK